MRAYYILTIQCSFKAVVYQCWSSSG